MQTHITKRASLRARPEARRATGTKVPGREDNGATHDAHRATNCGHASAIEVTTTPVVPTTAPSIAAAIPAPAAATIPTPAPAKTKADAKEERRIPTRIVAIPAGIPVPRRPPRSIPRIVRDHDRRV